MISKDFGMRLKFARKVSGLKAEDIANKIHISSANYYYRYEQRERIPPSETIVELCILFDVTPNFLFGKELDLKENLIEKISLLPPIEIEFLSVMIDELIKKTDQTIQTFANDTETSTKVDNDE